MAHSQQRATAEARLFELCALINEQTATLVDIAERQSAQLGRLEEASVNFSQRLHVAGTRAGLASYADLLERAPPKPDDRVPKFRDLKASECRVRPPSSKSEPLSYIHLPKPRGLIIVERASQLEGASTVSKPHPLDSQKSAKVERKREPSLATIDIPVSSVVLPKRPEREDKLQRAESSTSKDVQTTATDEPSKPKPTPPPPPPGRTMPGDDAPIRPRRSSLEESNNLDQTETKKPKPPPPRRASEEDMTSKLELDDTREEPIEGKRAMPPPPPRRASEEDVTIMHLPEESPPRQRTRSVPPPIPKRSSSDDISSLEHPKSRASSLDAPAPLPRPPSFVTSKRTTTSDSSSKKASDTAKSDDMEGKKALIASMLAGGSRPASTSATSSTPSVTKSSGGSNTLPQREEIKTPKRLDADPQKASAANELQKKLLGGQSKKHDLAKYQKMQKTGLPQGAIEHAMRKDGVDPKLLFG